MMLMKYLLTFLLVITTASLSAQKIQWMTMNEALAAQEKAPKKIKSPR